jgi:hypothetical protein
MQNSEATFENLKLIRVMVETPKAYAFLKQKNAALQVWFLNLEFW